VNHSFAEPYTFSSRSYFQLPEPVPGASVGVAFVMAPTMPASIAETKSPFGRI
jgi:hypothetical protein